MLAQFKRLTDEIVAKVMEENRRNQQDDFARKKKAELRALTKGLINIDGRVKSKRDLLEDIRQLQQNKANNPVLKAFSKAAGAGVPQSCISQTAESRQKSIAIGLL